MSPWDSDKSTAADPDNPAADEQLTAAEWDAHVGDGHFPSDEVNFGVDNGDPVMTDPQNADEVIARYDRSEGAWVVDSIKADRLDSRSGFTNETNNRAFGTWYQNTTGRDLFVRVFGVTVDTDQHTHILDVSDSQSGNVVDKNTVNPGGAGEIYTVSAVVPDGFYYRYRSNEGFFSINTWVEQ